MRQYLLWNPYKVSQYLNLDETEQSVVSIMEAEAIQGHSVSTYLNLKDDKEAKAIYNAILNETDCTVRIEPCPTRLEVVVFRKTDYPDYQAALEDGSAYQTGSVLSLDELISQPKLVRSIYFAIQGTSECINSDQADIEAVLIDLDASGDALFGNLADFIKKD